MKKQIITIALLFLTSFGLMAQITGTVTNSSTQAPIANHTVYVAGDSLSGVWAQTTTNSQGQFSFANLGSSSFYDVFTYDCNQNMITHTVYSSTATTNFSICVNGGGSSCQAAFFAAPDSNVSTLYHFTDQSSGNPTSWYWQFGDGTSSTLQNPSHQYASSGTYIVTLSISSPTCNDSTTSTITISGGGSGCQAAFTSQSNPSNSLSIQFTDQSSGNPTSWSWNFGDGSTSSVQNPQHIYATSGTYSVTLTISNANCQNSITQNVNVNNSTTSYSITGYVLAGTNNLMDGKVSLFDSSNFQLISQVNIDSGGFYTFSNIAQGSYYIYATPNSSSPYFQTYSPTYYQNSLLWGNANVYNLNANATNVKIDLVAIVPQNGPALISGNLSTVAKGGVSGAVVHLIDANNATVATTKTDAQGDYSFNNMAYGTYKIWVEMCGKSTTPITTSVDANNQSSLHNDFVVKNNTITPKATAIANSHKEIDFKTFPNPFENQLNIALNPVSNADVLIEVYNLSGQQLFTTRYSLQAGPQTVRINLNELAKGSYILKISNSDGSSSQQLISKF
jgi:PKD repeat protein